MGLSDNQIKAFILFKLAKTKRWGGKHTAIDNLGKGLPSHIRVGNQVKDLIKDGFLILKITGYGKHVSLNPKLMKDIFEFIDKYFKK